MPMEGNGLSQGATDSLLAAEFPDTSSPGNHRTERQSLLPWLAGELPETPTPERGEQATLAESQGGPSETLAVRSLGATSGMGGVLHLLGFPKIRLHILNY